MDAADGGLTSTPDAGVPAAEPGASSAFGRRATAVLLLISVLGLLLFLVLLGASSRVPATLFWASAVSVVLGTATAWIVAAALGGGAPWASSAALVLLAVMFVGGLVQTVIEMAAGSIRIPLDSLLAAWAIAPGDRPGTIRLGRAGAIVVMASLTGTILLPAMSAAQTLTAAGRDDLRLTATIDCSIDRPLEPGARATLRLDWSWARDELVPPTQDAVRIEWHAYAMLSTDEAASELPAGAEFFVGGPASDALAQDMVMRNTNGLVFGFDPAIVREGSAAIVLQATEGTEHQIADIIVTYAHGEAWRVPVDSTDCLVPWNGDEG